MVLCPQPGAAQYPCLLGSRGATAPAYRALCKQSCPTVSFILHPGTREPLRCILMPETSSKRGLWAPDTEHSPEEGGLLADIRISRGREAERRPPTKTRFKTTACSEGLPSASIFQLETPMWLSPRTSNAVHCFPSPAPSWGSHLINLTLTGPQVLTAHPNPCPCSPALPPHTSCSHRPLCLHRRCSLLRTPLFGATRSAGTPQALGA